MDMKLVGITMLIKKINSDQDIKNSRASVDSLKDQLERKKQITEYLLSFS